MVPPRAAMTRDKATLEADADRTADAVISGETQAMRGPALQTAPRLVGGSGLRAPGEPLDATTLDNMQDRLQADFSTVRVHADGAAAASARKLGAQAYADGEHLVFGAGQYRPGSRAGAHLLAHELTHVLQQRDGAPPLLRKDAKAPPDPQSYDPTQFTITPPAQRLSLAEAQAMTQQTITDGGLTAATVSGAKAGSDEEIMLHVILSQVGQKDRWGTEVDIVAPIGFPPAAGGAPPMGKVTVRIDTAGKGEAVLVSAGEVVLPSTYAKREDAEKALQSKYGIAEVKDGDAAWKLPELNQVVGAFTRVPAGDVTALKGVVLERVHAISGSDGDSAGEFAAQQDVEGTTVTNDATLRLADSVFPATQTGFVGGAGNAAASGYFTVLHEVGHAVESKARRDALNAQFRATAARNELVEKHDQAIADAASEKSAYDPLTDEYNTLAGEVNALSDDYNAARKGGDKDTIAAAKTAYDAKNKELADKRKEVAAQKKKLDAANAEEKAKRSKVDAATATEKSRTEQADKATARPVLLARAKAAETTAVAALKRAQSAAKSATDDSAAYRAAADQAGKDLTTLATAVKAQEDATALLSTARDALTAAEDARTSLTTNHSDDPALATFAPVDKAQSTWFDALERTIEAGGQTERVRKFVEFVTAKKIQPFTAYARENWPDKPEEFFAEAYSLFLSDPEYLKKNAAALHGWFASGSYK
jgi:hypothetical protein